MASMTTTTVLLTIFMATTFSTTLATLWTVRKRHFPQFPGHCVSRNAWLPSPWRKKEAGIVWKRAARRTAVRCLAAGFFQFLDCWWWSVCSGLPADNFHGTHLAGIVGARTDNGIGVAGVSPAVNVMACKFLDSRGNGYTSDAIRCMSYALQVGWADQSG